MRKTLTGTAATSGFMNIASNTTSSTLATLPASGCVSIRLK